MKKVQDKVAASVTVYRVAEQGNLQAEVRQC